MRRAAASTGRSSSRISWAGPAEKRSRSPSTCCGTRAPTRSAKPRWCPRRSSWSGTAGSSRPRWSACSAGSTRRSTYPRGHNRMDTQSLPDAQAPAGTPADPPEPTPEAASDHEGGPQPAGADTGSPENGAEEGAAGAAGGTPDEFDELARDGAASAQSGPSKKRNGERRLGSVQDRRWQARPGGARRRGRRARPHADLLRPQVPGRDHGGRRGRSPVRGGAADPRG